MRTQLKRLVASVAVIAMVSAFVPAYAANDSRIEGMIVGPDGSPAAGYEIHLVVPGGQALMVAITDENGLYTFEQVPVGAYALGIITADGVAAPVMADPLEVGQSQLVRRDLQLQSLELEGLDAMRQGGLANWWGAASTGAKVGVIVGFVGVVGYGLFELFDDDDEDEGTPMEMMTER